MKEYSIKNIGGHILIKDDNTESESLILIDTGSPSSFHKSGRLNLCGSVETVPTSLLGVNAAYVSEHVGAEVDGLVGMDFINEHPMSIDIERGVLAFDCSTEGWNPLSSKALRGCAAVDVRVNGKTAKVLVDTGAPVSYIDPKFTDGLAAVETVSDFSPMLGGDDAFDTPVFDAEVAVEGQSFEMRVGNLPATIGAMLRLLGVDGAFGIDFFRHFPILFAGGKVFARS